MMKMKKALAVLVGILGMFVCAEQAAAQRHMPSPFESGPFTAPIINDGSLGIDQLLTLEGAFGFAPDHLQNILFYDKETGIALFVKNCGALYGVLGHPVYETAEWVTFVPNAILAAVREENQRLQTVIAYQTTTGKVYRFPQRFTGGC